MQQPTRKAAAEAVSLPVQLTGNSFHHCPQDEEGLEVRVSTNFPLAVHVGRVLAASADAGLEILAGDVDNETSAIAWQIHAAHTQHFTTNLTAEESQMHTCLVLAFTWPPRDSSIRALLAVLPLSSAASTPTTGAAPKGDSVASQAPVDADTRVTSTALPPTVDAAPAGAAVTSPALAGADVTRWSHVQLFVLFQGVLRPLQEVFEPGVDATAEAAQCQCTVCLDGPATELLLPCNHLSLCASCAARVPDCPVCRSPVHQRLSLPPPSQQSPFERSTDNNQSPAATVDEHVGPTSAAHETEEQ